LYLASRNRGIQGFKNCRINLLDAGCWMLNMKQQVDVLDSKYEIRSTKHETNLNDQNSNGDKTKGFEHLRFEF
jgi:hypothetical protein